MAMWPICICCSGNGTASPAPRTASRLLVLEKGTPGLSVVRLEDKMGTRASSTATIAFDNCRVSRANLIGEPGDGLKILFASLNKSRPSVAAHALGIARAAFEDSVQYINERVQSGRKILEFPKASSSWWRTLHRSSHW